MTSDDATTLRRIEHALAAQVGAETVVLDPDAGTYWSFGSIGTRIWELLETPASVDELLEVLLAEFDVDPESCRRDVLAFVEQLRAAGLVEAA